MSLEGEVSGGWEGAVWALSRSPHVPSKLLAKRRSRRGQRAIVGCRYSSDLLFRLQLYFLNMTIVGKTKG